MNFLSGFADISLLQILIVAAVAVPGAFLAKSFVERMPVHVHAAILDVAVIIGGMVMIVSALRAL